MIQKDLQGNLWECKIYGSRSSGKTFRAYQQEIERLNNIIDKAIEYIETWCYDEYSIAIKIDDITCSSEPKAIDKLLDILKGETND